MPSVRCRRPRAPPTHSAGWPPRSASGVASPLPSDAEPFDIPGTRLSHRRGLSTFHTLLDEYRLADPVLRRIARIVDEADTVQEVLVEPAAPGLDMLCRGVRLTSPDDHAA